MEKSKILCYNVDDSTLMALSQLSSKLKISVINVPAEDYGRAIAAVATGVTIERNPLVCVPFEESMAVFVSIPDTMLDVLLSKMREKKIKISLKAVLTPYNAVWDANTLYQELCRERKEIMGK